jgi:hypothetical protein
MLWTIFVVLVILWLLGFSLHVGVLNYCSSGKGREE